jgi:tetratricopeptide (TPR) repeat protein
LGDAYAYSKDFIGAFNAFDRMLMVASRHQNRLQEAFAFGAMARARMMQGQYDTALDDFTQMEVLARENNNPLGEAAALEGQAQAQEKLVRFGLVIEALQKARQIYMSLEDDLAVRRVTGQLVLAYLKSALDRVLRLLGMRS